MRTLLLLLLGATASAQIVNVGSTSSYTATGPGAALTQPEIADPGAPGANTSSLYANSIYQRWVVYNHNAGPKVLGTWMVTTAGGLQLGGSTQVNGINTEVVVAGNSSGTGFFNESSAGVGGFTPAADPSPTQLAVERGQTVQKPETGADTNLLTVTPAATAGLYRACVNFEVSAQNTATLGWTATWTDSNGSAQAPTNMSLFQTGVAAPALTFTAATNGNYYNCVPISINNAGTNIVIKTTFSGTSIAYKASATLERL